MPSTLSSSSNNLLWATTTGLATLRLLLALISRVQPLKECLSYHLSPFWQGLDSIFFLCRSTRPLKRLFRPSATFWGISYPPTLRLKLRVPDSLLCVPLSSTSYGFSVLCHSVINLVPIPRGKAGGKIQDSSQWTFRDLPLNPRLSAAFQNLWKDTFLFSHSGCLQWGCWCATSYSITVLFRFIFTKPKWDKFYLLQTFGRQGTQVQECNITKIPKSVNSRYDFESRYAVHTVPSITIIWCLPLLYIYTGFLSNLS